MASLRPRKTPYHIVEREMMRCASQQNRLPDFRNGSILLKKSPATGSIAQNGEFQNPKGRVLESKFFTEAYFEKIFFGPVAKNVFQQYRSKADISQSSTDVRYSPESGHSHRCSECLLSVKE